MKCFSLAIHPNKLLVASGQAAGHDSREGRPHIRVWNSVSLSTVCVLGIGEFERSIACLSFSKADGGALLCAVDEAHDHSISVWDWQKGDKGYKVTETKCSVDTVVAAEFHPLDRNCIVTCGKAHISFWALDAGGTLYKRMGIFENRDKPKYVTCLAFTQTGDVLSGDSNGNIIVWGRGTNTISRLVRNVHEGSIFSICVLKEGSIVSAGGKDGRLIQFDSNFQPTGYEAQIAEHLGGVRTVSEGRGTQLLIGSTRNCILIGSLDVGFSPAVLGHTDELWALSPHPSLSQFLTAGFDKIVQLWDSMSRSVVWSKDIAEQAQSAAFSPDGSVIVIGGVTGRWLVMDSETREIYSVHTDGMEPIQVVRFSPDSRYLALGSRDNNIYIYQVGEDMRKYSRVGRCTGHSSFITHLDWSADSQYLRSNSGDYELLFCKQHRVSKPQAGAVTQHLLTVQPQHLTTHNYSASIALSAKFNTVYSYILIFDLFNTGPSVKTEIDPELDTLLSTIKCLKIITKKRVKYSAIRCTGPCAMWFHTKCVNMDSKILKTITKAEAETWHCNKYSSLNDFTPSFTGDAFSQVTATLYHSSTPNHSAPHNTSIQELERSLEENGVHNNEEKLEMAAKIGAALLKEKRILEKEKTNLMANLASLQAKLEETKETEEKYLNPSNAAYAYRRGTADALNADYVYKRKSFTFEMAKN
ncbi:Echinoderm microtubule-associated protein-like 1 [Homalodisca vitripennis]|nr:Echinoderm microtubule-associated protein-like 1 [Homalodisca vitripennis]